MTQHTEPTDSVYARLGGENGIRTLVDRFYALMDELPEAYAVRGLHPDSLQGSADSLFMFLSGWFGGPPLFMADRGHPRLRVRHAPYAIGPIERDEWLLCMQLALDEQVADLDLRDAIWQAFVSMAEHLVNSTSRATCGQAMTQAVFQAVSYADRQP